MGDRENGDAGPALSAVEDRRDVERRIGPPATRPASSLLEVEELETGFRGGGLPDAWGYIEVDKLYARELERDLKDEPQTLELVSTMSDDDLAALMTDLGGHCLETVLDAFLAALPHVHGGVVHLHSDEAIEGALVRQAALQKQMRDFLERASFC